MLHLLALHELQGQGATLGCSLSQPDLDLRGCKAGHRGGRREAPGNQVKQPPGGEERANVALAM